MVVQWELMRFALWFHQSHGWLENHWMEIYSSEHHGFLWSMASSKPCGWWPEGMFHLRVFLYEGKTTMTIMVLNVWESEEHSVCSCRYPICLNTPVKFQYYIFTLFWMVHWFLSLSLSLFLFYLDMCGLCEGWNRWKPSLATVDHVDILGCPSPSMGPWLLHHVIQELSNTTMQIHNTRSMTNKYNIIYIYTP